mmetsp:Transcript_44672/g.106294  ORF Transcript_44672/g.106294 Transcript_44672/m.106294 type:complete len:93 (+) Transcript_44672:953-1231(+)
MATDRLAGMKLHGNEQFLRGIQAPFPLQRSPPLSGTSKSGEADVSSGCRDSLKTSSSPLAEASWSKMVGAARPSIIAATRCGGVTSRCNAAT